MGDMRDLNQYLQSRNGRWHYVRRILKPYLQVDNRAMIRKSLRTSSLEVARARRDALVEADNQYWSTLSYQGASGKIGLTTKAAINRYQSAKRRAMARGFIYTPVDELAQTAALQELIERFALVNNAKTNQAQEVEAVLGGAKTPSVKITEALEIYFEKIAISELLHKSENQIKSWRKVKLRAISNFGKHVGNIPMDKITRKHARKFYGWWGNRLKPKDGKRGLSANSANRDLGNVRKLYREYWEYVGEESRENPFRNLHYTDNSIKDVPPFADDWVRAQILKPNIFKGLKNEAALLVYDLIETGCRPSELANLLPENIVLEHEVPHIRIRAREDMQLKSKLSIRDIPLVGVSLEAFKKSPSGFPHYRDRSNLLSASLMDAFRKRDLFSYKDHRIYSFRHSFEKRMLEAGLDYGLRCLLMGHKNSRPYYGDGGSMEFRRDELLKIAHPVTDAFIESLDKHY